MTRKEKKRTYLNLITALKQVGIGAINDGLEEDSPVEQLHMALDYLKHVFKKDPHLFGKKVKKSKKNQDSYPSTATTAI